jgi:hypothetical protein
MEFTVPPGKRSEHPRCMLLVTRTLASSEQAWEPMASSRVNSCRKTRTLQQSQPDDPNPNTAESMVKRVPYAIMSFNTNMHILLHADPNHAFCHHPDDATHQHRLRRQPQPHVHEAVTGMAVQTAGCKVRFGRTLAARCSSIDRSLHSRIPLNIMLHAFVPLAARPCVGNPKTYSVGRTPRTLMDPVDLSH